MVCTKEDAQNTTIDQSMYVGIICWKNTTNIIDGDALALNFHHTT